MGIPLHHITTSWNDAPKTARNWQDELLKRLEISHIISEFVALYWRVWELRGTCPFCNHPKQSLYISDSTGMHLFLHCDTGGNMIRFFVHYHCIDPSHPFRYHDLFHLSPTKHRSAGFLGEGQVLVSAQEVQ
jgi:hypothetical protein